MSSVIRGPGSSRIPRLTSASEWQTGRPPRRRACPPKAAADQPLAASALTRPAGRDLSCRAAMPHCCRCRARQSARRREAEQRRHVDQRARAILQTWRRAGGRSAESGPRPGPNRSYVNSARRPLGEQGAVSDMNPCWVAAASSLSERQRGAPGFNGLPFTLSSS